MQEYKEAWAKAREQIAIARKTVKDVFEKEAVAFVNTLPIESFSWVQYTPYFNDGDACVFGVYTDYPEINGFDEYGLKYDDDGEEIEAEEDDLKTISDYRDTVATFLSQFEEDDYEYMFGDGVRVIVNKSGIEVEDYDHD
jgi:hypothetical protein